MQTNELSNIIYHTLDLMRAKSVQEFSVPPRTFMGVGSVSSVGETVTQHGLKRIFVMVDNFLHQQHIDAGLYRSLNQAHIDYQIATYQGGEPNSKIIDEITAQLASSQCDSVLAFGGGSVLDAAKVVALKATNPNLVLQDLMHPETNLVNRLPLIAIPTTAGTGSEATNISVITDATTHIKQLLVHPYLIPDIAILDAGLTQGLPAYITAFTGIDALTHAIETYVSLQATPLTRLLAKHAITLIGEFLPKAVGQGNSLEARDAMIQASYIAGMAFSNAGLGACHATAHQIGAKYGIPHGMANSIMLPAVMRFNQLVCKQSFAEIGHALTGQTLDANATIDTVQQLIYELGLTKSLNAFGAKAEDLPALAQTAIQDACLKTNPRTATVEQIITIYEDALASNL